MNPAIFLRCAVRNKLHNRGFISFTIVAAMLSLAALAIADTLPTSKLISKLKWRSVGPYIGGRVIAVTGVPSDSNLFYMGTVGGGVWKSTDYGLHWENISDGKLHSITGSVGAIAVSISNPKIIYVGMGETDIRNTMMTGDGVYKSIDAGKTWDYVGLRDTHTISNIAIDPKNPDVVYAGSMGHVFKPNPDRGVYKSTDGGKTWNKVLFVNDETGCINLVMEPNNPEVLYASMWQAQRTPYSLISGGPGSGIYKSTDGGAHWINITRNEGLPKGVLGRMGIGVTAANANVVYAIIQAKEGGVFRSEDGGKTWKRVNDEMKLRQRAFYYMAIWGDPKDANTAYAPQVDALFVSHDAGKTWKRLRTPHGDNHAVWINPHNTSILLEGNDGGATVSTDGGKTWSQEHNQPTGQFYHVNLDDQFPYHIYGAQQDEGSFEGPSADAGGSIPTTAWDRVAYGESTYSVPQPGDPNVTYGSGYYSIFVRYNKVTGQYESVSPWPNYQEGAASNELKYRFSWTHAIIFSPSNPKELLIGAQYVLKSDDLGRTWQKISPDLTRKEPQTELPSGGPIDTDHSSAEVFPGISALAVSPKDDNIIWAGSNDGLVHVTTDGGSSWQSVTPPDLPSMAWINSVQPSYSDTATAYVAARNYMQDDFKPYVYKTTDNGKTWTSITNGLPADSYVFDLRQDPNDPDLLLLGTSNTIYVSFNAGANWQPLTLNLPTVQVRDIAFNTKQDQVAIATHGRSFWVLDNLAFLEQMTRHPQVDSSSAYLFAPQKAWLTHAYGARNPEFQPPDSGANPAFGATVFFDIPPSYDGKTRATLEFQNAQGETIHTYNLHLKKKQSNEQREKAREALANATQIEQDRDAEEQITGIEPGMNSFQWNLRYPDATNVNGFHAPVAAGGLDDNVEGPEVVPGTYTVVLDYADKKTQRTFDVALDPRLNASQDDLQARLALDMKIHEALDSLDKKINQAMAVRERLEAGVRAHRLTEAQAGSALADLNREIEDVVQMQIKSSEGSLLHETKLHSYLAYLAADVEQGYVRPTQAQQDVFDSLDQQAKAAEQKLDTAVAAANKLL